MNKQRLINLWEHLCESGGTPVADRLHATNLQYNRKVWQFYVKEKGVIRISKENGFRIMMFPSKETAKEFDLPELVEYRLTEEEYNNLEKLYQTP